MRTPFGWTLPWQVSLQVACACFALWGAPAAVLAATGQITPTPVESTPTPAAPKANNAATRSDSAFFNRRVLTLVAIGCLVGMIIGRARRGPPETRFRLLHKPKKMGPPVLVPPRPVPRLIPGDSPNATRARSNRAPMPRQTPAGAKRKGAIDYIAVFSDSGDASAGTRIDYLLVSGDSVEESLDPAGGFDVPPRDAE